ncbi:hypothetical protein EVAR_55145_1 [Eumeta japonica]|uniref:Uncharacterized protein n=1 Tax=Eumeta variegata TaxID=151549 RepID=A0A4C1YB32_EUMVA|nr:hypothetical protein EVAR_55145_1 [Eumeta japonica]
MPTTCNIRHFLYSAYRRRSRTFPKRPESGYRQRHNYAYCAHNSRTSDGVFSGNSELTSITKYEFSIFVASAGVGAGGGAGRYSSARLYELAEFAITPVTSVS